MIQSGITMFGYNCSWIEVAVGSLIILVAIAVVFSLWCFRGVIFEQKEDPPTSESLDRQVKAAHTDCENMSHKTKMLSAAISEIKQRIKTLMSSVQEKTADIKRMDGDIDKKSREYDDVKARLGNVENEREKLEKEVGDLEYCSLLQQRAVISGQPGDEFFVRVKIQGQTKPPTYQDVIRAAKEFSVPLDLPKIDSEDVQWAFQDLRQGCAIIVDNETAKGFANRLFFVGDVHGDADALRRIIEYVFRTNESSIMIFLGDLFDRGAKSMETARMLMWAAKRFPGQILWLAGNHDVALGYDETNGQFTSDVTTMDEESPKFKDELNAHPELKDEGLALLKLIKELPRACILGNVWASHGGVPQSDVSNNFTDFTAMSNDMLDDCVWSRMKDAIAKIPNRSHRGAEVGCKDAQQFFAALKKTLKISISHMVCAHQHEHSGDVGCLQYTRYFKPDALSCQCVLSFCDKGSDIQPCILVYTGNEMPPTPHTL